MILLIYSEKWGENYKKISCEEKVTGGTCWLRSVLIRKSKGCFYKSLHYPDFPVHYNTYSFNFRLGLINRSVYKVYCKNPLLFAAFVCLQHSLCGIEARNCLRVRSILKSQGDT